MLQACYVRINEERQQLAQELHTIVTPSFSTMQSSPQRTIELETRLVKMQVCRRLARTLQYCY